MRIFEAAAANGDSATYSVGKSYRGQARLVRFLITGTCTVTLYGRMDANDTWFTLGSAATASGVQAISLPAQIKATISGKSGTISVDLWADAFNS